MSSHLRHGEQVFETKRKMFCPQSQNAFILKLRFASSVGLALKQDLISMTPSSARREKAVGPVHNLSKVSLQRKSVVVCATTPPFPYK